MSDYLSMTALILFTLLGGAVIGYQYRSYRCEHALRRRDADHAKQLQAERWRGIARGIEAQRKTQRAASHSEAHYPPMIVEDSPCLSSQKVTDSVQ